MLKKRFLPLLFFGVSSAIFIQGCNSIRSEYINLLTTYLEDSNPKKYHNANIFVPFVKKTDPEDLEKNNTFYQGITIPSLFALNGKLKSLRNYIEKTGHKFDEFETTNIILGCKDFKKNIIKKIFSIVAKNVDTPPNEKLKKQLPPKMVHLFEKCLPKRKK